VHISQRADNFNDWGKFTVPGPSPSYSDEMKLVALPCSAVRAEFPRTSMPMGYQSEHHYVLDLLIAGCQTGFS
jgi:hypothetical protein